MFRLIKLLACLHAASRDVFFRPRSEVEPRTPGQLRRRTAVWVRAVLAVARRTRAHPVAGLRPARAAPRHDARSDRRRLWPAVARWRGLAVSAPLPALRPMLRCGSGSKTGSNRTVYCTLGTHSTTVSLPTLRDESMRLSKHQGAPQRYAPPAPPPSGESYHADPTNLLRLPMND